MRPLLAAVLFLATATTHAADLPDWSGWWLTTTPLTEEWTRQIPPLKPAALAQWGKQARPNDEPPDPVRFCRPLQFTGYSGGFEGALEFLITPGRVTLTSEDGRLRRIYTDGRAVPAGMDVSGNGISVGRWEGSTLVVTTTHIDPRAGYPSSAYGSSPIGRNVRIEERIALQDPDTLVFDIETTAPDVLTGPDRRKRVYKRTPKVMAQEITFCGYEDRSVDARGRVQFDLTPPKDLPPPPPR